MRKRKADPAQGTLERYFAVKKRRQGSRNTIDLTDDAPPTPRVYTKTPRRGLLSTLTKRRLNGAPLLRSWARPFGEVAHRDVLSLWSAVQHDDADQPVAFPLEQTNGISWDSEGRLFMCTRETHGLTVVDSVSREVVFDCAFQKEVSAAVWDAASDVCALASFAHTASFWKLDLEVCDEAEPTPVSEFSAPSPAAPFTSLAVHPHNPNIIYASSRDGSVYLYDTRAKLPHTGTFSPTGTHNSLRQGGVATFGSARASSVRVTAPQATCVTPINSGVACGYMDGRVSLFDVRNHSRGAIFAADIAQAPLRDENGTDMPGIKLSHAGEAFYKVDDILPSPYLLHAVVCLVCPGWVVELDLAKGQCSRVCYPDVLTNATPATWATRRHRTRMHFIEELSAFAVPAQNSVKLVPWDRHHFGKWETCLEVREDGSEERKIITTSSRGWQGVSEIPLRTPLAVTQVPWSRDIMASNPLGVFQSPLLPGR